jgi:hypothetical protein
MELSPKVEKLDTSNGEVTFPLENSSSSTRLSPNQQPYFLVTPSII